MPTTQFFHRLAVTCGEPAGIGPDLCIALAWQHHDCEIIVIADPEMLLQRAKLLNIALEIRYFDPLDSARPHELGTLTVFPVSVKKMVNCGQLNKENSRYVIETIRLAAQGCLDGLFSAMVTAPVHKGVINDAGLVFTGHTEYIAAITSGHPVMMLATPGLRVALVTTHLPLAEVPAAITPECLSTVIQLLDRDLRRRFSIRRPNILVCGLNPHAGENGHLGMEEIEVIIPTLEKLRSQGLRLQGPLPADTIFTPKYLEQADVVLAMYHDQGLPVLKHLGFGLAVNITLGLPIIRTSVDHGTALELAGTGLASGSSLDLAIKTALEMTAYNPMHF
jgi:4-hydroxythreonine-4-phosphate dehydrogenase